MECIPSISEGEEDINLVIEKGIEKHKVKGNLVSGDKSNISRRIKNITSICNKQNIWWIFNN